jgi:hypothetical protein
MKNLSHPNFNASEKIFHLKRIRRKLLEPLLKAGLLAIMMLTVTVIKAQSIAGSTWDLATSTPSSGYTNWGSGVISLTDTVTGTGTCQGSAVTETSGYNPTTDFSKCFMVFFGCPGNDVIGTLAPGNPYTDQNGDGMSFSFWKSSATMNANNANTCGGGLGYENSVSDGKMITIEFDTYSSLGTSNVDGYYGGGAPGSGSVNDEISLHKDANSGDAGLFTTTAATNINAGQLEDGLVHQVCITYVASTQKLTITIDGVTKLNAYDLTATYNLNNYFGGATLNYSWSAGKYGANNLQTLGPVGVNMFATIGHNPCTGVVLPVELLTFTGEKKNETTILSWATATEINNKKFIIERSSDLSDWKAIGEIAGAGNSVSMIAYSFTDYSPSDGKAYYRLRQIDINGAFAYSNVVAVQTEEQSVSIAPNPFDDILTIKSNIEGDMDISIHDVLGRLQYRVNQKSENGTLRIQPDLPGGAYVITIQAGAFVERQKLIKK